jgi:transposase
MDQPECPGCRQRDREIEALKKRVAELKKQVAEQLKRLDDKERAGKRQAAPFSKGEPKADPKTPGRKAGDEHGTHVHRPPPTPDQIDETHDAALPEHCPHCGGDIAEDDEVDEQFQTDIPVQPIRRKFRIHKGCCKRCGRRVRGRHPLQTSDATGAAQSQIGPNAQAAAVYLNKRCGMSYGKIADYFVEANGLDLNPSTATRIVLRGAKKQKPVYDEIRESIKNSSFIVPDETGWRIGGHPVWLHAWVGDQATCYVIGPNRSADALEKLIGLDYSGKLTRDGASTYDRFEDAIQQLCVGHPLRRAHDLEEYQIGRAKVFPRQVIDLMQEALALRDLFRIDQPSEDERAAAYEQFSERLRDLAERPRVNERNDIFAGHLSHYSHNWFAFLLEPEMPATNHLAEQALRTPIVNRKVFGGNRTDAGGDAQAITSSTIQTCKQQKRSAFAFLRDTFCGVAKSIFQAVTGTPRIATP